MDIFQAFLSHNDENPPTFSEIFHSAAALKHALGTKSYLLDHYLSLFFRLTAQIDFVSIQDEVHQAIADAQRSFIENPSLLSQFPCQEPATKINLCFLWQADSILERAREDFLREKTSACNTAIDLIELTASRTETHGTHGQGTSGNFSADAPPSFSSLSFGSIIFSMYPCRTDQTVSRTGFGNRSGGLSAVSENFLA